MKRYRYIALAILFVVLAVGLFVLLLPREPVYEGRPISEWISQLTGGIGSSAGAVSSHTLPKLVGQKPGEEIVPYLRVTLHRGTSPMDRAYAKIYPRLPAFVSRKLPRPNPARDAELRYRAALVLYYIGSPAKKALPGLLRSLKDPNPEVRRISATVLGSFGVDAQSAAPGLTAALGDPSPEVRRAALKALGSVAGDPAVTVPCLAQMLNDPDEGVRTDAAQSLRDLGPNARTAVRELIGALGDRNEDVFRFAALALGKIGPEAREAVPALLQALQEDRAYSETTLRWALDQIDPQALTTATANR
jgi:HEAT repeat protein